LEATDFKVFGVGVRKEAFQREFVDAGGVAQKVRVLRRSETASRNLLGRLRFCPKSLHLFFAVANVL